MINFLTIAFPINLSNQIIFLIICNYYDKTIMYHFSLKVWSMHIQYDRLTRYIIRICILLCILKTAYVHFTSESCWTRAYPAGINIRLSVFPLHPCLPQPLDHLSLSRCLFPSVHRFILSLTYILMGASSTLPYIVYYSLRRVEWSKAERSGMDCRRPPLMWFWERESRIRLPAFLLCHFYISFYYLLSLSTLDSIPFAPHLLLPIFPSSTTSTY